MSWRSGKLIADCPQRIPSAFSSHRDTIACPVIPVDPTAWAQSFAILPAQSISWHCKEPGFSYRRFQIERCRRRIERKDVRIIRCVFALRGKNEVCVFGDEYLDFPEAAAARHFSLSMNPSAEVEAG